MGDFNMPPGVSVNDIPGNRPEDVAEEVFWLEFSQALNEEIKNHHPNVNMADIDDEFFENELITTAITVARDMGYNRGYNDGLADESYEES
jgi:hypothetical protein